MDAIRLLNEVRTRSRLRRAMTYALHDRTSGDFFYNPFEIDYVVRFWDRTLDELFESLSTPDRYAPGTAYAYYPPKSDLCYRRMIYVPFKDLAVRYALIAALADVLDPHLSTRCFANRRAPVHQQDRRLLADFAEVSWPGFCDWQRELSGKSAVLLRTDISAFYDSISHGYLKETIAAELGVPRNCDFMRLLGKSLAISTVSYSHLLNDITEAEPLQQGLTTGSGCDGFLANVFLKHVDEAMAGLEVQFGRYNDDMRVFAASRQEALDAVLVLQQQLLGRCLNLNASKTDLAENPEAIARLRSKVYESYAYSGGLDDDMPYVAPPAGVPILQDRVDKRFDEFDRVFDESHTLRKEDDAKPKCAKEFCMFLSRPPGTTTQTEAVRARLPWHVDRLDHILRNWKASSKHASWLLVQTACYEGAPGNVRVKARKRMLAALSDADVSPYAKYRVLHYVSKLRERRDGTRFRFVDEFSARELAELREVLPALVGARAFELALAALYVHSVLGASPRDVRALLRQSAPLKRLSPLDDALWYLEESVDAPAAEIDLVAVGEPDDGPPQPY